MIRTEPRIARKVRRCESCLSVIRPGDEYLEHVASPHHGDLDNEHWWRTWECADCATRYGRGDILVHAGAVAS